MYWLPARLAPELLRWPRKKCGGVYSFDWIQLTVGLLFFYIVVILRERKFQLHRSYCSLALSHQCIILCLAGHKWWSNASSPCINPMSHSLCSQSSNDVIIYWVMHYRTLHCYAVTWKLISYLLDYGFIHNTLDSFYWHRLTLIPGWISNHMPSKVWVEITHPFPNFNAAMLKFGNG